MLRTLKKTGTGFRSTMIWLSDMKNASDDYSLLAIEYEAVEAMQSLTGY